MIPSNILNLYQLKNNTKKTVLEIQTLQETKLRKMLLYAYTHSKYYHRTFSQVGITEENINSVPLSSFPTIDKSMLLQNFDDLVTVSDLKQSELYQFDIENEIDRKPFKGKYHIVHSSGSTGTPGYFVYDEHAWNSMLLDCFGTLIKYNTPFCRFKLTKIVFTYTVECITNSFHTHHFII